MFTVCVVIGGVGIGAFYLVGRNPEIQQRAVDFINPCLIKDLRKIFIVGFINGKSTVKLAKSFRRRRNRLVVEVGRYQPAARRSSFQNLVRMSAPADRNIAIFFSVIFVISSSVFMPYGEFLPSARKKLRKCLKL